jgi:membrane protein YdbS with pleckstrin-like domain
MAWNTTRRRSTAPRRARNTAPAWKKFAVVLSAPVAVVVVIKLLDASGWSFLPFAALIVAVAAAAVWLTAKLLGVHLSLGSWD